MPADSRMQNLDSGGQASNPLCCWHVDVLLDFGHMLALLQSLGKHCCPASTAKLRVVCRNWHDALTRQFAELFIGPGSPWQDVQQQPQLAATAPAAGLSYDAIARSFPAAHTLHVTASSTRDYPPSYTEVGGTCRL